ncbi:hypothetical protein EKO27_g10715 [Xylaria grammica]|uniref:Uncharacterized protein n=1 Tax=Xylaria grammica TaxID=363999 RepID=A0A439CQG3_9PEZI|nr:hypothetical protein EKO27_g10715 [Xylaria grammica]
MDDIENLRRLLAEEQARRQEAESRVLDEQARREEVEQVSKTRGKGKVKGKGNRVDYFCIYGTSDGTSVAKTVIEYKVLYKLMQDEVITGLVSEIQLERDVINKDGEDFVFMSRALAMAVIT